MVACVVVNWNHWQDTVACLRTVAAQTYQPLRVIVVENGSTNDSAEQLRALFRELSGSPVEFAMVETGRNLGFPSGANVGVRRALADGCDWVWLLNNDTECPPDTLAKLMRTADANPQAGAIGTVLYYHDDPSTIQAWSGGRINRWLGTATHFHGPTEQRSGCYTTYASALIRAEVLRQIGLLYEGFFMYYDDSDFCLRMEKTPWKIAVAEDTAVLHKESASTEGSRNPFMEKTIAVSAMKFVKRHSPAPWLSLPAVVLIKLLNRARRGEFAACRAVLAAVGEYRKATM